MSNFGDQQLNNVAQSLEEIENYLGRISTDLNRLVNLLAKELDPPKEEPIKHNWDTPIY